VRHHSILSSVRKAEINAEAIGRFANSSLQSQPDYRTLIIPDGGDIIPVELTRDLPKPDLSFFEVRGERG